MKVVSISVIGLVSITFTGFAAALEDEVFWQRFVQSVDSFTPPPTPPPVPGPTPSPTPIPTGQCIIDTMLNCTSFIGGQEVSCEDITEETQSVCSCPECVRELKFQYTGLACSPELAAVGTCVDLGPNPFIAGYQITDCDDASAVVATGEAEQGDMITLTPGGGFSSCLPDDLCATISVPGGSVTQQFQIDSECGGGNGFILKSNYGAFESLGYSCSDTDTHNCIEKVTYNVKVCNTGSTDEQLYKWILSIDGEKIDLLEGVPPTDVQLSQGECYYDMYMTNVDRCDSFQTCVEVEASVTNPETGLPTLCENKHELCYEWESSPVPPPTPSPSPFPSPQPSPAPTSSCVIDVNLTGCPKYDSSLDNDCQGRPWVMTFRYNGGNCEQSNNLQPRQKFSCTDVGTGPPTTGSAFITVVPRGGSERYYQGTVDVGGSYTVNEDKLFDKLAADMTITTFDEEDGNVMQIVDLHLSCSQPLFLFDKFGSHQVTEWEETSGRVVSATQNDVQTGDIVVELDATTESKPVRLLEMTILSNTQEEPYDYTDDVAGQVLQPGESLSLPGIQVDIDLSQNTRYTFFTTIIGETLDGTNQCNGFSFLECTIGFNLLPVFPTGVPTPSPTSTPYPTGDLATTACEIDADIECAVLSLEGVSCEDVLNSKTETCPENAELLNAYLRYDGSAGDNVFLEITCDTETAYIDRTITSGETVAFRTRANACPEVNVTISDIDPDLGGTTLSRETIATSCPGPWTLGNTIAGSLVLDAYVDTVDDGVTIDVSVSQADVQLTYLAGNDGHIPTAITGGTYGISGSELAVPPATIPPRSRVTLDTVTQTVDVSALDGAIVTIGLSLQGTSANEFAIACSDEENLVFQL